MKMKAIVIILLFTVICTLVDGHQNYQQKIPNGEMVPHPCKLNFLWRGVGHENVNGGGILNAFGSDFANNDHVWNATLCLMDSDGDGRSNGLELGDPDCLWKPNEKPTFNTGLSHPGVCDPIGSAKCTELTGFVNCEQNEFSCPILETENSKVVSEFAARLSRVMVSQRETTYLCKDFEFPRMEQHIVAFKPYIYNKQMVHHIVIFGCQGEFPSSTKIRRCGMVPNSKCMDVIAVWSLGMSGHCMHKDCGILVGSSKGYKWAAIQVHWNNPQRLRGHYDSSGIIFYLSSKLRPYNAGILNIGQTSLAIPAGKEEYIEWGSCDTECTKQIIKDEITVVSVYNHMHYLGKAQTTDLIKRVGTVENIQHLAEDTLYNYDDPVLHEFVDGVIVKAGDELKTTCVYKSTSRHDTTYFGDDTDDEMCFSFLTYFPEENSEKTCLSNGRKSQCTVNEDEVCDPTRFSMQSSELLMLLNSLQRYCTPGVCRNECLSFVKDLQKDSCFGEVDGNLRRMLVKPNEFNNDINVLYAALDSCNKEILMEQIEILARSKGCKTTGDGWQTLNHASETKGTGVYLMLPMLCLLRSF